MRNVRQTAKPGTELAASASTLPPGDRLAVPSPSDTEQPSFINRAVVIGLWCYLIAVPLRLEFAVREFIGTDSPFHARYASLFFSRMFTRTFPTTAYSIWSKQWGDKEFLFHAYLAPFCRSETYLQAGAKLGAALLFSAVLCSIGLILKRQKVSGALWWAALLPALSVGWDFRMLMVRSHVASVLLILWILHLFEQRRQRPLLILVFLYTWTYTAPYFALVLCGFMALGRWGIARFDQAEKALVGVPEMAPPEESGPGPARVSPVAPSDRSLLLTCAAATLAGLLIHPQTPNQFLSDWLHLSLVAMRAWGLAASPVELGSEFQSETLREGYSLHPGVMACLALIWLLILLAPSARSGRGRLFAWMTLPVFALYGLSGRFIEYLAPLVIWALAVVSADAAPVLSRLAAGISAWNKRLLAAGALIAIAGLHVYTLRMVDRMVWHPEHRLTQEQAGLWIAAHAQPGDLVVPLDWTQFPQLYFYAPRQRYVVGLEPTSMQVIYPERLHYLEEVRLGKRDLDMNELRQNFPDARYVVVWAASGPAIARLARKNYVTVFADSDAVIYDVSNYLPPGH